MLKCKFLNMERLRSYWKLNCCPLKDIDYVNLGCEKINRNIEQFALIVYDRDNLHNVHKSDIHFTIRDSLQLETILMNIRGLTIQIRSKKARNCKVKDWTGETYRLNGQKLEQKYQNTSPTLFNQITQATIIKLGKLWRQTHSILLSVRENKFHKQTDNEVNVGVWRFQGFRH